MASTAAWSAPTFLPCPRKRRENRRPLRDADNFERQDIPAIVAAEQKRSWYC
jgi:hypothetical protein